MKIHKVIGSVTLARCHPCYQGTRLLATEPLEQSTLTGKPTAEPDLVAVWDDLGAGVGNLIAVSDGAEAAQPLSQTSRPSTRIARQSSTKCTSIHEHSKSSNSVNSTETY